MRNRLRSDILLLLLFVAGSSALTRPMRPAFDRASLVWGSLHSLVEVGA